LDIDRRVGSYADRSFSCLDAERAVFHAKSARAALSTI